METITYKLPIPEGANVILGQTHFIKTAEDLYEAMVNSVPNIKFGLAFCEASGPCLVRSEGNDPVLKKQAEISPKGIETEKDVTDRKEFLRKIGYKIS